MRITLLRSPFGALSLVAAFLLHFLSCPFVEVHLLIYVFIDPRKVIIAWVTHVTSLLQMLEESIKASLITDSVENLIYLMVARCWSDLCRFCRYPFRDTLTLVLLVHVTREDRPVFRRTMRHDLQCVNTLNLPPHGATPGLLNR